MAPTLEEQLLLQFVRDHATQIKRALVFALSQSNETATIDSPNIVYQFYLLLDGVE